MLAGGREKIMSDSDLNGRSELQEKILGRVKKSSFAPAAVLGAFASFAGTAFGAAGRTDSKAPKDASLVQIGFAEEHLKKRFAFQYSQVLALGASASEQAFRHSLSAVAVGPANSIYVLGDGEVRVFNSGGSFVRAFKTPQGAICLAVGSDERVYLGRTGRVEILSGKGTPSGGFAVGEGVKPSAVTAIRLFRREILVADVFARRIRRFAESGKQTGEIGIHNKTRGFMLPNRFLDMDVDGSGIIRATDPGRHRVSSWNMDGTPAGHFGQFGLKNPEDFVGCCNPVNISVTPDGKIVTAEKVIARIKVFEPSGKLLALIGPEHFDPMCTHLHLAVDSDGRILVADPMRREVKVFAKKNQSGGLEHL